MIFVILLALCIIIIALLVALRAPSRKVKANCVCCQIKCPTNIFNVTSTDLWPCQAKANLAALNLSPSEICKSLPAIFPGNPEYNTLRLNVELQQQSQPLFIVRPTCESQVVETINLARNNGLQISVRSGGHCNEPFSIYNPIVISIGSLNSVSLDEETDILTCGGGATQGQVFKAIANATKPYAFALAQRHHGSFLGDLGVTTGNAADVGLSGIVSAGGVGFLQRLLGLTIDSVTSLRIALANGTIVEATSDNQYSDLWAAARGSGGGNYGVITQIQLQLHQIDELIVFAISWSDWTQAATILAVWQTLAPNFPNNLTQQLYFSIADGATVPTVSSAGVFVSPNLPMLQALLQPFLTIPSASVQYQRATFATQATKFASGRLYNPFSYRRTNFVFTPINDVNISLLISQFEMALGIPGTHTIEFDPFGGQVQQPPLGSSAFYPRNAIYWLLFVTTWQNQDDSDANLLWSQTIFDTMRAVTSPYCYTGFMMNHLQNFLNSYYGTLVTSLRNTKTKYDPNNFFSFPQSIPPL